MLEALSADRSTPIKIRQDNYLNNVVEQDHRAVKRIVKPMMGFNASNFYSRAGTARLFMRLSTVHETTRPAEF